MYKFQLLNILMHLLSERERKSKIYLPNVQSIPIGKDQQHCQINEAQAEETKYVQEKKKIDKIMLGIIKERMFDSKVSAENYYTIDMISRQHTHRMSRVRSQRSKDLTQYNCSIELANPKAKNCSKEHYHTIDAYNNLESIDSSRNRRSFSRKLPKIIQKIQEKYSPIKKLQAPPQKKLDINEKSCGQKFKKWAGGLQGTQTIYDIKVSRESIINSYRKIVDGAVIERFFHFFCFPQSFSLRHYCNLVQNAINYSLKFIYFWVFSLFDQNCNGILQSQDLFRFLQRFPTQNTYIEQQVYRIARYLRQVQKNFKPTEEKQLIEETLVVNHNLKMDQLIDLMKLSEKERIDVNCVKNTCYHQTVMSIQHDPLQREKITKIETNQIETLKRKQEMLEVKKKLQNTPGLRLRDFYVIFGCNKRPRIFCYFINLLTGENGSLYQ